MDAVMCVRVWAMLNQNLYIRSIIITSLRYSVISYPVKWWTEGATLARQLHVLASIKNEPDLQCGKFRSQ